MPEPRKHCSYEALMRHSSCCGDEAYRQCSTTVLRRTKKMVCPRMSGYGTAMSTSSVARLLFVRHPGDVSAARPGDYSRLTAPAALTVSKGTSWPQPFSSINSTAAGVCLDFDLCPCEGSLERRLRTNANIAA
jgi:hypothetical protein